MSVLGHRGNRCVLAALALALAASVQPLHAQTVQVPMSAEGRRQSDLATGWRFHLGADVEGAAAIGFDDSGWDKVDLPHTWNRIGEYRLNRSASSNNVQGVGWYRLTFKAPVIGKGNRQFLQFDGVGNIAEVWVNGIRVGAHEGAFSRFRFDVTSHLRPGQDNLIAVKADNSKPEPGSTTAHILPLSGDFFIYGGLYRGVSLITTESAQIDVLDHGGPGIYAHASEVTPAKANVTVLTRLRNFGASLRALSADITVRDADGQTIAKRTANSRLGAASSGAITQTLVVANPRLWNGRADPYLYSVTVELRDGRRVIDRVTQPLGIRTFRVDADEGFFLNGRHLALNGVSRHQDRQGKGWALSPQDHAQDMALIADLGANTVRMAHYQHADEWATEADKAGMVAWAEVPFVTTASFDGNEASPATTENARQQLRELIRQNYNHPSIVMWSIGNEIDAGAIFMQNGKASKSLSLLENLNALAKQEDPTRLTTFADCCESSATFKMLGTEKLAGTADLIGYNRYFGWYYGSPADLGSAMDEFHAKHPDLPVSVSEYGAGGALTQHSDNPLGGPINAIGRPHPEEFQSWYHEESWKQIRDRKYIFGSWIWNMFDFASDLRLEGESIDLNDKGLVTFDREVKKDAFYFYKANWSNQPVLHINSRRYVNRAYPVTDVRVYSNASTANLTLNGVDVGPQPCPDRICVWPGVKLRTGKNVVEVRATIAGRPVSDTVTWNAPDAGAGLKIDAGDLAERVTGNGDRYGSDNFFSGGTGQLLNAAGFSFARKAEPKFVKGTGEPGLHDAWREGSFSYNVPLPNGKWTVTIHSFEPDATKLASRTFSISANGRIVAGAFSPGQQAGGALIATEKSFLATVRGGRLKLDFTAVGGPAIISAIVIAR